MEHRVYGSVRNDGLEVIERDRRFFVRYDAGTHQVAWREDEITQEEYERLRASRSGEYDVIIGLQRRLSAMGEDPYQQNWTPPLST